jgi:Zn-dependent M16 (insulinase) family peptidase
MLLEMLTVARREVLWKHFAISLLNKVRKSVFFFGSCSHAHASKVRKYHSTYYVPHNFVLVVAGKLSDGTEQLLSVVQNEVEPSLIAHGQNQGARPPGWKRPFVETSSANRKPIEKTIKETVEFPEQDESSGELIISFMGPPTSALLDSQALDHLGNYFTSSPTAPLNKEYIETESPLWSDTILLSVILDLIFLFLQYLHLL